MIIPPSTLEIYRRMIDAFDLIRFSIICFVIGFTYFVLITGWSCFCGGLIDSSVSPSSYRVLYIQYTRVCCDYRIIGIIIDYYGAAVVVVVGILEIDCTEFKYNLVGVLKLFQNIDYLLIICCNLLLLFNFNLIFAFAILCFLLLLLLLSLLLLAPIKQLNCQLIYLHTHLLLKLFQLRLWGIIKLLLLLHNFVIVVVVIALFVLVVVVVCVALDMTFCFRFFAISVSTFERAN